MNRLTLLTISAGLLLIGAAPAHHWHKGRHHSRHAHALAANIVNGYPACSATVTDRCIQLYERGVASAENLAFNEKFGPQSAAVAEGGPFEPVQGSGSVDGGAADATAGDAAAAVQDGPAARAGAWDMPGSSAYPPCSASVTDRCIQRSHRR